MYEHRKLMNTKSVQLHYCLFKDDTKLSRYAQCPITIEVRGYPFTTYCVS